MLEVSDLEVRYGNVAAVKGVSLRVGEGEVVAVIGPNGAGKTSTLRAISGLVPSAGGRILLGGRDISRWKAHRVVALGLAPMVVREIARIVQAINREQGVSVLLVEQNARMAFGIASRAYVMETGRVTLSGSSSELTESPHVKAAYLGGSA